MYHLQYIPRNVHTVFALLGFVVVIHWLIFPYPSGLLHWHCGNLTIAPVPAKQPWWIWINTSCEFIMNDYITTTKQSTTKPCAYFLTRFSHTLLTKMTAISGAMISTKGSYHSYAARWLIVRFHGDSKPRDGALKWWYRCNIWHASRSSAAKSHSIPKCLSQ